jgi:hypothetical protein
VSDEWTKIRYALENPNYKWRTIEGIAQETAYPVITVLSSLSAHSHEIIRSTIPSTEGRDLFTTKNHYFKTSSLWNRLESAITNKVRG